jgi:hypothetical protein
MTVGTSARLKRSSKHRKTIDGGLEIAWKLVIGKVQA